MTLIWATKIKEKWTLLADSGVTTGQLLLDATTTYRPKIREIEGNNIKLIVASAGVIRDVDFALNIVEDRLEKKKFKNTKELKMFLQETLADIYRELKTLNNDPEMMFIFLEPKTDTLRVTEWYGLTEPKDCAHIVLGSGDTKFYKSSKMNQFFDAFKHAVECDEYCEFPIVSYRDWKVDSWYWVECSIDFYNWVCNNESEEKTCSEYSPVVRDDKRFICGWTDKAL